MEGVKLFGGSNIQLLFQNEGLRCSSDLVDPLWLQGSRSLEKLENAISGNNERAWFQSIIEKEDQKVLDEEEDFESCLYQQGKKRRLTTEQVEFLERSFEAENKLEPERKVKLAKDLGLHPRQVAIWFQNRRARFKTKQMEKDYDALKSSFDSLKAEHDNLLQEKLKLEQEVNCLKSRLMIAEEKEEGNMRNVAAEEECCGNDSSRLELAVMGIMRGQKKQEDYANSSSAAKSGDSEQSSLEEEAAEHSDFSRDEKDNNKNKDSSRSNLMSLQPFLPQVEDDDECCNFGFAVEDQPFCFWSY